MRGGYYMNVSCQIACSLWELYTIHHLVMIHGINVIRMVAAPKFRDSKDTGETGQRGDARKLHFGEKLSRICGMNQE